ATVRQRAVRRHRPADGRRQGCGAVDGDAQRHDRGTGDGDAGLADVAGESRTEAAEQAGQGGDLLPAPTIAKDGVSHALERGTRLGDALPTCLGQHDIAHPAVARIRLALHEPQLLQRQGLSRDGRLADIEAPGEVDATQTVGGRLVELHQEHEVAQRQTVEGAQTGIDPRLDEGLGAKEAKDGGEGAVGHAGNNIVDMLPYASITEAYYKYRRRQSLAAPKRSGRKKARMSSISSCGSSSAAKC